MSKGISTLAFLLCLRSAWSFIITTTTSKSASLYSTTNALDSNRLNEYIKECRSGYSISCRRLSPLEMTVIDVDVNSDDEENDPLDEDEEEEIGTMKVSDIKAELKLRGVDFSDCFDKESLALKLVDARKSGKADPSIVDNFNRQKKAENPSKTLDDDIIDQAVSGDGTLPGGMPPDVLKNLVSNPEVMALMSNPKMQDAMKIMMTGGQDAMENAMRDDPELYKIVTKLNEIMGEVM